MEYLIVTVLYLFIINIITTIRLIKSKNHESFQKTIQILLIWLLPVIGTFMVSHFLNDDPIIIKNNLVKYSILKILLFPFFMKVIKLPKERNSDISSSNHMTTADISGGSGSSYGGGGD